MTELEDKIPHAGFSTWFSGAKMAENRDGHIIITTPNVFKSTQLRRRYDTQIREAFEHNGVEVKSIEYTQSGAKTIRRPREVTVDEVKPKKVVENPVVDKMKKITEEHIGNGLKPEFSLDNFVIGEGNRVAVNVAHNIINDPGGRFNPFFLYGGPGLGKTHLVQAIGNALAEKYPNFKILYVTTLDFFSKFVQSLKSKRADAFMQVYHDLDVLIIDDIQMIVGKAASQDAFFNVFNDLQTRGKQVIVTSDRLPDQIKTLDRRLSSRLAMTGPIDLQMPNFEDRCAILKMKAEFQGREIEQEVVEYIASNIKTNIRELDGELNKILFISEVRGVSPIELIHSGEYKPSTPTSRGRVVSPVTVVAKTAEVYNLSADELKSRSRVSHIKNARQVAMYLLQEELGMSTTKIALEVGVKDHTTVMHGVKKIRQDLAVNFELREKIDEIKRKLYE